MALMIIALAVSKPGSIQQTGIVSPLAQSCVLVFDQSPAVDTAVSAGVSCSVVEGWHAPAKNIANAKLADKNFDLIARLVIDALRSDKNPEESLTSAISKNTVILPAAGAEVCRQHSANADDGVAAGLQGE
ncbi:hypothetical protein JGU66_36100 [Myxococcaceae bacterium JPH2]|nr:hypothetical protein [Myxococcaceae bacterium JPH2]